MIENQWKMIEPPAREGRREEREGLSRELGLPRNSDCHGFATAGKGRFEDRREGRKEGREGRSVLRTQMVCDGLKQRY